MTTGQTPEPETPMEAATEETGGVSGMVNLTINLPDNIRISTIEDTETTPVTPATSNATGTIVAFAGATAPQGWLLCNGAAVSRATYSDLFDVIGTDYGVGNANTTFNLPDLRGRFPLGKDDMGGVSADNVSATDADTLGGSGGIESHTLTTNEIPAHHHGPENPPDHVRGPFTGYWMSCEEGQWELEHHTDISGGPRIDVLRRTADAGGGQAHNNMPPYQTVSYIIKT